MSLTVEEDVLLILRAPFVHPEAVRHEHLGAGLEGEGLRAGQPSQNRALFPKFLHEKSNFLLPSCLSGWLAQVLLSAACLSWREDLIGFSEVRSFLMRPLESDNNDTQILWLTFHIILHEFRVDKCLSASQQAWATQRSQIIRNHQACA